MQRFTYGEDASHDYFDYLTINLINAITTRNAADTIKCLKEAHDGYDNYFDSEMVLEFILESVEDSDLEFYESATKELCTNSDYYTLLD